jgi:hypothetical protein
MKMLAITAGLIVFGTQALAQTSSPGPAMGPSSPPVAVAPQPSMSGAAQPTMRGVAQPTTSGVALPESDKRLRGKARATKTRP